MKEDIAMVWIAALRSGKYPQAKGALRTKNGFCCLGVLCDLKGVEWQTHANDQDEETFSTLHETAMLPDGVVRWAGMHSADGLIPGTLPELTALNDDGKTFPEIADLIEAHWRDL